MTKSYLYSMTVYVTYDNGITMLSVYVIYTMVSGRILIE